MDTNIDKELRDKLVSKYACFVLITCDSPSKDGKINVAMSYEGDPLLAAYMLQGAQSYLEENEIEEHAQNSN